MLGEHVLDTAVAIGRIALTHADDENIRVRFHETVVAARTCCKKDRAEGGQRTTLPHGIRTVDRST